MKKDSFKPGQKAGKSGQYGLYEKNKKVGVERTVVKGEPFPPTPKAGQTYRLDDETKH